MSTDKPTHRRRRRPNEEADAAEAQPAAPRPAAAPQAAPAAREEAGPTFDADALLAELEGLDGDAFGKLLARGAPRRYKPGEQAAGTIVRIEKDTAFVDIGAKSEAMIDLSDLGGEAKIGDSLTAHVLKADASGIRLARKLAGKEASFEALASAQESGVPVDGKITAHNSGGFTVYVGSVAAFCPLSQIDRYPPEDPAAYLDKTLPFRVLEITESKVVLSHRALQEAEAAANAATIWEKIAVGDSFEGVVTGVRDFGAFVDIGGVQGLVHRSELSWDEAAAPPERGNRVSVRVLEVDRDNKRLSLSLKDPAFAPWARVGRDFVAGEVYEGTVARLAPFGAFVELAPGVEGLVHVSNITSEQRITHPKEALQVGQKIQVRLMQIDKERQRLDLGMKQVEEGYVPPTGETRDQRTLGTMADLFAGVKVKK